MKVELPYADGTLTAGLPEGTRCRRFAFHPIHGILATHPLKRLRHVGRVIVAAARDPHVPRHLGFEVTATVEEAIARARTIHGRGATIGVVAQPPMPADPKATAVRR